MTSPITIHLSPQQFSEQERLLVEAGELQAFTFRFASGVEALRLKNSRGELLLLPYLGQQIWSAAFDGRNLTWRSMQDQPYYHRPLLETYGAFLVHCGISGMGVPGPVDSHPLHGELPVAVFQEAELLVGEDEAGPYLGLSGTYHHTVTFNHNYLASPLVKLYAGKAVFPVSLAVHNLKNTSMPLMYLAHVNFRPVDYGRLTYTALATPEHVRVRASFPSFVQVGEDFRLFVETLVDYPEKHHVFEPSLSYDPELVFAIDYLSDSTGWARTLQVHPDGGGDLLRHRPAQLKRALRWISRTLDQQALGFEPATAEGSGYTAELAKGNVEFLGPGDTWRCDLEMGLLTAEEVLVEQERIEHVVRLAEEG
jgi:hypothetical protein